MNDSIASAEENTKNPKSLFQQIERINNDEWDNEMFEFSPHPSFHQSFQRSQGQNSFANDLPLQSKIHEQFLQAQEALNFNILNENEQNLQKQKSQLKSPQPSSLSQNSNFPSQATITLHEQTLASKVYEQIQTQDDSSFSISLKSFLNLNNKNYRPHIACMKNLYEKLKDFSKRSLDNLRIYINFLEIKMKQQIESLKLLDQIQINFISPQFQFNQDDVNIDERVLMDVMKGNNSKRRMVRKGFYDNIKQVYENLLSIWKKTKQKRQKKQRYIQQQILRVIQRIELQMQDMIKCRLLNEKQKVDSKFISEKIRSHNPYLTKDKYLQMKYLIQRENAYLKLITDLNGKLITYMINIFSKEQIQMAKGVQDAIIEYANYYMKCYDHNNQIICMKIAIIEEVSPEVELKLQLADVLTSFIPKELYEVNIKNNKFKNNPDKLEAILGDFSQFLQNTIFLPSIQMNNEFIMFRNEAIWKTKRSILQKQQSAIDYQSKQALANSRSQQNAANIPQFKQNQDIKIVVVLTSNYFLHLQNEDKVATIKLGDVKLSKKGRQVIITDRGKGISGYFGIKSQLGRLQFESTDDVEVFAQKLSYALRKITFS